MEPRLNSHVKSCEKHRSKTQTQQREDYNGLCVIHLTFQKLISAV